MTRAFRHIQGSGYPGTSGKLKSITIVFVPEMCDFYFVPVAEASYASNSSRADADRS